MSDLPTLRFTSALALALVLATGCESASEGESTLPQRDPPANPTGSADVAGASDAPPRPGELGAWVDQWQHAYESTPHGQPVSVEPPQDSPGGDP